MGPALLVLVAMLAIGMLAGLQRVRRAYLLLAFVILVMILYEMYDVVRHY